MSSFYVIATPIGNLSEISNRALEAFNNASIIFCEDTRVTKKLLQSLNIDYTNKKFYVVNAYSESEATFDSEQIKSNDCCLVSDAGYPLISDPGFKLIQFLNDNEIKYEVVNGPCAIIHALLISKFPTNSFYFYGFLNASKETKLRELNEIKSINSTIVLYESVHKLINTLDCIKEVFGDIIISVCKELTKLNEKVYHGMISEIKDQIELKGEFVIVFENKKINKTDIEESNIKFELSKLIKSNIDKKTACKMVGYKYDIKPNKLYDLIKDEK